MRHVVLASKMETGRYDYQYQVQVYQVLVIAQKPRNKDLLLSTLGCRLSAIFALSPFRSFTMMHRIACRHPFARREARYLPARFNQNVITTAGACTSHGFGPTYPDVTCGTQLLYYLFRPLKSISQRVSQSTIDTGHDHDGRPVF